MASIALVFGALTHIIWDSFTHRSGMAVANLPAFRAIVLGVPLYKVLQHGSTLLGLLLIARWYFRLPVREVEFEQRVPRSACILAAFAFVVFAMILGYLHPPVTIGRVVVESIDSAFLTLLTVCLWFRSRRDESIE
jgi:hypothetical protein